VVQDIKVLRSTVMSKDREAAERASLVKQEALQVSMKVRRGVGGCSWWSGCLSRYV
jgi:hypothetical protein